MYYYKFTTEEVDNLHTKMTKVYFDYWKKQADILSWYFEHGQGD